MRVCAQSKRETADFETSLNQTIFLLAVAAILGVWLKRRNDHRRRRRIIEQYRFAPELSGSLRETWPDLTNWQIDAIERALRSYFIAYLDAGSTAALAMPSKAADALWHAFVLDTRAYHAFCVQAFGHYFHHIPAYRMTMRPCNVRHDALDRTWGETCRQAGIDPRWPDRLPMLFMLDGVLRLTDAADYDAATMGQRYRRGRTEREFRLGCGGGGGCSGGGSDGGCCGDGGCGGGCGGGGD